MNEKQTPSDVVLETDQGARIMLVAVETQDGTFTLTRSTDCTLGHEVGLAVGLMRATVRHIHEHLKPEDAADALKNMWDQIVDDFGLVATKK